jgi:putative selenate reductase molybdopterin-binding subunit
MAEIALDRLPAVLDASAAAGDPACVAARVSAAEGDVEGALAGAQHVIEGEWSLPFSPAVALEPPLAVTWLDEDRRLVVRTSAESSFRIRGVLADRLSLPAARIRVVRPLVAGGSLGRVEMAVEDLCALVTLRTGRPARLALGAEEELTTTPGRPAQRVGVRLGHRVAGALGLRLLVDPGRR